MTAETEVGRELMKHRPMDSPEQIEMCLSCSKTECTNCIGSGYQPTKRRRGVSCVRQYDSTGTVLLAEYPSFKAAVAATGFNENTLRHSEQQGKKAHGFVWIAERKKD